MQQPDDHWFAKDKMLHALVGGALGAGLTWVAKESDYSDAEAMVISLGLVFSLGTAKEYYDHTYRDSPFSGKDMMWNMAAATVGSLVVLSAE